MLKILYKLPIDKFSRIWYNRKIRRVAGRLRDAQSLGEMAAYI